jgi:ubiquinone/menaquinone biosynthesis C-methylase UbiE
MVDPKAAVRDYWNAASCGEAYAKGDDLRQRLAEQARQRYALEPYLPGFARFADGRGKDVLEIGVGMGADHERWARESPRSLTGVDLTPRAIEFSRQRLEVNGLTSHLQVADAEALPFEDASFDLVYSWGVLHHSPDTARAFREVHRVLRPGGEARLMIYNRYSVIGMTLWTRYALLRGRLFRSLDDVYSEHMESPGTKAYTPAEARRMLSDFADVKVTVKLSFGDLLMGESGQRHRGPLLSVAKALWPRPLIRAFGERLGSMLLIDAHKARA